MVAIAFRLRTLGVLVLVIAGTAVVTTLIMLSIGDENVGIYPAPNGQRFVVQRLRNAFSFPVFITSFIFVFGTTFYFFRKQLAEEQSRLRPDDALRWERASHLERSIGYAFTSLLVAVGVGFWIFTVVVLPYNAIREITISRDTVQLRSAYANWSIVKGDIAGVETIRRKPNRGGGIEHGIVVQTHDGRVFRSGEMLTRPDPGSPEDNRIGRVFEELATKLRKR